MIRCLHCGAETSNGLGLCGLCRQGALERLESLPIYFRNLSRWRPGRAGSRQVPGSRVLFDGEKRSGADRISRSLDETGAELVGWAEALADDRPSIRWPLDLADLSEAEQAASLCGMFTEYLVSMSTLDWVGEFVRSLGEHETHLRSLTMSAIPGYYAGACRYCETPTYVVPGLAWVTCQGCGVTTHARDHLDVILSEARAWEARPMRLAEALVALLDSEQSVTRLHDRIRQWSRRGQIEGRRHVDRDGDLSGPKYYRLGDVLDRLMVEGQTRGERATPTSA